MSTSTRHPIGTVIVLERPVNIEGIEFPFLVTFPCTGAYRPTFPETQYGDLQGNFYACLGHYVVTSEHGTELHGSWQDEREARAFARSVHINATWRRVDPYMYQPAFGRVSALLDAIGHDLDPKVAEAATALGIPLAEAAKIVAVVQAA